MEEKEIMSKVLQILKPFARNEAALATMNADTNILKDLQVNSSRLVDIILEFEEVFNVSIGDDEADSVTTVGSALELIKKKLA